MRWYQFEQIWLAVFLLVLAVSVSMVIQRGRPSSENEAAERAASSHVNLRPALPDHDIPGGHDFREIGRPPDSKIIWTQKSRLAGLTSVTVKYISRRTPVETQLFFTDKLMMRYSIIRDDLVSTEGYGWSGIFADYENNETMFVFSASKRIGPPPGGNENPTEVSVMKVSGD